MVSMGIVLASHKKLCPPPIADICLRCSPHQKKTHGHSGCFPKWKVPQTYRFWIKYWNDFNFKDKDPNGECTTMCIRSIVVGWFPPIVTSKRIIPPVFLRRRSDPVDPRGPSEKKTVECCNFAVSGQKWSWNQDGRNEHVSELQVFL